MIFKYFFRSFYIRSGLFSNASRKISTLLPSQTSNTIFALSSAQGKAGVAIIRVSGPKASEAVNRFSLKNAKFPKPRVATPRSILHPITREVLDYGLVLWFPGEDVVEFHIHGGNAVIRGILDALSSLKEFRHAERGEFTRRAFDNDKLDLTEIEGIADLINAETEMQRRQALRQAQGRLRNLYETWRQQLIENMALVEAVIDFGEEENIEDGVLDRVRRNIHNLVKIMSDHINDNRRGEILRDGIHVTIMGPPNAGKSSFLNYLAQRQAAIVSPIPGTTRDIVDVFLNIGGYPIVIGDTAGLRKSDDVIEIEGIKRAKDRIMTADIKICILSLPEILNNNEKENFNMSFKAFDEPIIKNSIDKDTLLILNKKDLVNNENHHEMIMIPQLEQNIRELFGTNPAWEVSCVTGEGMQEFLTGFLDLIKDKFDSTFTQTALITQSRHRQLVSECIHYLENFSNADDVVLAAEELRYAVNCVGKITGRVDVEEILEITNLINRLSFKPMPDRSDFTYYGNNNVSSTWIKNTWSGYQYQTPVILPSQNALDWELPFHLQNKKNAPSPSKPRKSFDPTAPLLPSKSDRPNYCQDHASHLKLMKQQ
ncbi:13065_t:CDS:10 [Ambispora gerdemannii]|uniref:13065_t:CDS:1 n=1 Tax=Ambispora gerdemannii TaxID=144530 RepID=A0A9N8YI51_9GLOM|nr:13065_t:CDS:10 [Ambispora gerdemannii]